MPVGSDTGTRITFLQNKYFQGSVQPVNVLKKYIFLFIGSMNLTPYNM